VSFRFSPESGDAAAHPPGDHRLEMRRALPILAAAALIAGCGDSSDDNTATSAPTRTVDDTQVEQGIESSLSTASAPVSSAKCPSDVTVEQGDTFTCTVTFENGATGKATVTQKGANNYTYELKPGSVEIPGATVSKELEEDLAKQGAPNATVTCPENIIVKVGTTVTCDVSGAQGAATGQVTFTFSSEEGTVDSSSVDSS
jgi:Domain of unknown function (DUF4333)